MPSPLPEPQGALSHWDRWKLWSFIVCFSLPESTLFTIDLGPVGGMWMGEALSFHLPPHGEWNPHTMELWKLLVLGHPTHPEQIFHNTELAEPGTALLGSNVTGSHCSYGGPVSFLE